MKHTWNCQSKICSKQMDKYCVTSIYSTKVITSNDLIDNEDYCLKDCHDYQLSWSGHSQHHSEWNKDGCRGKVCWYQSIDIDINVWPTTITVLRTKRNCCQFAIFVLLNVKNVFISLQKLLCRVNHRVEFLHAFFYHSGSKNPVAYSVELPIRVATKILRRLKESIIKGKG